MIDPTAMLNPRSPLTNPRPGDVVSLGKDSQYTVTRRAGSAVDFDSVDRGRRRSGTMALSAWLDMMAAADVAKVAVVGIG